MISLRQHAISIVAIFLALTLGLFLGSGFIGDKVNSATGTSRDRIGDLEAQRDKLNTQVNAGNSFVAAVSPQLLAGKLAGSSVIVVTAPNAADGDVAAVKEALTAAGAKFSGQIGLTDQLLGDQSAEKLRTIIDQSIPAGASLRPELTDSGGRVGDLLGTLTLSATGVATASRNDVVNGLAALREGGYITYTDNAVGTGRAVVVVTGDAYPTSSGAQGQLTANLAAAMARRTGAGILLGRTGSAEGGSPIAVIRADPSLRNEISTVDNVDQQMGRVTTVLALAGDLHGKPGAYGTGPGARAITPSS
ncbi:copper transporter [Gordonia sp. TBRC 11910]|uniref:Copper transporter n=1 Tax=Gordonia asplenii TaxID=2725283 RepID=A0A848LCK3_9ACTN|nr:copper transporter [Gordonia asplenii]NMO05278.1 copper transporter [Gordonia asplenii]